MKSVFEYFEEIMGIPRESGKEEKIALYLINYAKKNNIEYHLGKYNTVFLKKNNHSDKTIILHAHSDMVCVSQNNFDFENKGIPFYIDGDYYKSKGTSLGADDGIGLAIILAILSENDNMPNIEVIITTQEETTMLGAMNFDYSLVTANTLISLDGINEGDIESSSAGMCSVTINKKIKYKLDYNNFYKLSLTGLKGGHSGDDIDKNRANAIKIAIKILNSIDDVKLSSIDFGMKDNVIPNYGYIIFSSNKCIDDIKRKIESLDFKLCNDDINFRYTLEKVNNNSVIEESKNTISLLTKIKDGLIEVYDDGFPLLSANIGKVSIENDEIIIKYSIRSSDKIKEDNMIRNLANLIERNEFSLTIDSIKPFFSFQKNSEIREMLEASYKDLYGKNAIIKKVHACMECGILSNNIKNLDICTIAPTINNCHSVNENVSISSTERVYNWLKDTLKRFNKDGD